MFVIKDEARGLFVSSTACQLYWTSVEGQAIKFDTRAEAEAVCVQYEVCTCWVVEL